VTHPTRKNDEGVALFLQECLTKPKQMGAVAPSSAHLARAMAHWLPKDPRELVLELGPGCGPVTEALLARGLAHDRLVAIEKSPKLAQMLRERFPTVRIIEGDAGEMDELLHQHLGVREVGAVISSLPLRSFPRALEELVTRKIHSVLKPGGCWVQFTYHIHKRRINGSEPFHLQSTRLVWRNLPPARVLVYQKRPGAAPSAPAN
jgi:phosphatidylethanolamine/phosphatidyl-N-methylethanolamine N-methyltransferase